MRRRLPRLFLTACLAVPLCLALLDAYGLHDRAQPADAIVVLGSQVFPGGRAGPALTRRTRHAVTLYEQGLAPAFVCTGGLGANAPTEAEAACRLAEQWGVPPAAILLEDEAHSTEENALYTAALAREHGWRSVVIVTDGFHLYRAQLLFTRAGLTAYASPAQVTAGPMPLAERYVRELRELAALAWYWGKTAVGYPATDFP